MLVAIFLPAALALAALAPLVRSANNSMRLPLSRSNQANTHALIKHLRRTQELNIQQLEALYSLLDDDGDGELSVHEMIDMFDGITNDALLIDDCDGNPNPHHCTPQVQTH
jgi:hypothetical protein